MIKLLKKIVDDLMLFLIVFLPATILLEIASMKEWAVSLTLAGVLYAVVGFWSTAGGYRFKKIGWVVGRVPAVVFLAGLAYLFYKLFLSEGHFLLAGNLAERNFFVVSLVVVIGGVLLFVGTLLGYLDFSSFPVSEMLEVRFDQEKVDIIVLKKLNASWNQTFRWEDINRVCFKDEGLYSSDILYVGTVGNDKSFVVLTEAKGGSEFFGELVKRGLFHESVMKDAISSTNGGLYCWPPQ